MIPSLKCMLIGFLLSWNSSPGGAHKDDGHDICSLLARNQTVDLFLTGMYKENLLLFSRYMKKLFTYELPQSAFNSSTMKLNLIGVKATLLKSKFPNLSKSESFQPFKSVSTTKLFIFTVKDHSDKDFLVLIGKGIEVSENKTFLKFDIDSGESTSAITNLFPNDEEAPHAVLQQTKYPSRVFEYLQNTTSQRTQLTEWEMKDNLSLFSSKPSNLCLLDEKTIEEESTDGDHCKGKKPVKWPGRHGWYWDASLLIFIGHGDVHLVSKISASYRTTFITKSYRDFFKCPEVHIGSSSTTKRHSSTTIAQHRGGSKTKFKVSTHRNSRRSSTTIDNPRRLILIIAVVGVIVIIALISSLFCCCGGEPKETAKHSKKSKEKRHPSHPKVTTSEGKHSKKRTNARFLKLKALNEMPSMKIISKFSIGSERSLEMQRQNTPVSKTGPDKSYSQAAHLASLDLPKLAPKNSGVEGVLSSKCFDQVPAHPPVLPKEKSTLFIGHTSIEPSTIPSVYHQPLGSSPITFRKAQGS